MVKHIINLLKGEVTARVESGFPERVLNLCGEYGLAFWDLQWESAAAFTFTLTWRDWKRLRRLTAKLDCELTPVGWRGTPFFLGRMRYRYGLWITLGVCSLLLLWGSFFIWDFEIEGNETVPDQEILRALEKYGVAFGTFGYDVNSFQLRNDLLLELPELSYIAINVRGSRAYVQVRERVDAPEIIDKEQPGNTVASKDALVTTIEPWDGEKMVLPGTMVKEGQLLISGVVDSGYGGNRYIRGMGKVYGRTWYTLQCRVPLTVTEKTYTGEKSVRRAVLLGKNRVNLYFGSSISQDNCDKIIHWNQWELPGGLVLPITVVTETLEEYTLTETRRSQEEAQTLGTLVLDRELDALLGDGELVSRQINSRVEGDTLLVTLTAECEEQIGKFVEIPKE